MFDLASINAMQTHTSAKPTFRTYAVLVCIFLLGAALLIHGLESWNEGSVRLKGRVGETFIATRGGPNAGSFYFYVLFVLTGGAVSLLAGLVLAWRAFLSRDLVGKAQALIYLNTPIRENQRMPIPTWLCWALVLVVLGIFAYAFIHMR